MIPSTTTRPRQATRRLEELEVVVLDCQSTGSSPARGHLLEMAWCRLRAADAWAGEAPSVHAELIRLPAGRSVPARITALTGIRDADLVDASAAPEAWRRLLDAAWDAESGAALPAVAHFARFERAFLEALHAGVAGAGPFPLDLLCTHEIACRVLPGLPRRGLRAVAGRLGRVMGEAKRAPVHVEATAVVWAELVRRLAVDHGVTTLAALRAWLAEAPPQRRGGRDFAVLRDVRLGLPEAPGVYRMLAKQGEVLYVGKATSLKQRVNAYFQKHRHDREPMLELLTQVWDVAVTETASPLEAALLESDEIKQHEPPYNQALRPVRGPGPGETSAEVAFATRDLTGVVATPDAAHPVGPLRGGGVLDALGLLGTRLAGADDEVGWRRLLAVADEASLDLEIARAGLARFVGTHALASAPLPRSVVLGLGARLWRAHLASVEARRAAEREMPKERKKKRRGPREPWTPKSPEQVVRALEGVVRHAAHAVRRARWLCLLSEASLVWQPHGRPAGAAWRWLEVEGGEVARADDVAPGQAAPRPPGWPRPRARRLRAFDLATFDRLRVLTTELKRLVAAGHGVELCFAPHRRLRGPALEGRLYWI